MRAVLAIRHVINHQAKVNDSHLVVTPAYHEVVRLDVSMQVVILVEIMQTIKSLDSYVFERNFTLKRWGIDVILDSAIKKLQHDVGSAVVKAITIILRNAF
jgi:hypothetical protein